MKVRRFALISFLLTLLLVAGVAAGLMFKEDYDIVIMLNLFIAVEAAGSWILTMINICLYLFNRPDLPGMKSYCILQIVMLVFTIIAGVYSMIMEKGFKGSSAEMMLIYLIPLLILLFLVLTMIEKKRKEAKEESKI